MDDAHTPLDRRPNGASSAPKEPVKLEELSRETGVSVDFLHTLAGTSNPGNEHVFKAAAARKAFAGVKPEGEQREYRP